jgi:autotransporter-associated beta strand protein
MNAGAAQNNAVRAISLAGDSAVASWGNRWDLRGPGGAGSFSGSLAMNNFKLTKLGPGQFTVVDANVTDATIIDVVGGILSFARANVPNVGYINLSNNVLVFDNYASGSFSMPNYGERWHHSQHRRLRSVLIRSSPTSLAGWTYENTTTSIFTGVGTIHGVGSLAKIGTGQVTLTAADSTWTGNTTIGAGILQIGSGAADGSLPDLPITNNGTLTISSLNSFVITNSIVGSGGITHAVGGTLLLGGSNSYAGTTALSSTTDGTRLRITNSFALGSTVGVTTMLAVRRRAASSNWPAILLSLSCSNYRAARVVRLIFRISIT